MRRRLACRAGEDCAAMSKLATIKMKSHGPTRFKGAADMDKPEVREMSRCCGVAKLQSNILRPACLFAARIGSTAAAKLRVLLWSKTSTVTAMDEAIFADFVKLDSLYDKLLSKSIPL